MRRPALRARSHVVVGRRRRRHVFPLGLWPAGPRPVRAGHRHGARLLLADHALHLVALPRLQDAPAGM